ncbi:UNVERIFIED_CONTAM: hypothetical protein GTU68_045815 [Idotea baltica]|nr:hypothetical protein [Idotea baltica]
MVLRSIWMNVAFKYSTLLLTFIFGMPWD